MGVMKKTETFIEETTGTWSRRECELGLREAVAYTCMCALDESRIEPEDEEAILGCLDELLAACKKLDEIDCCDGYEIKDEDYKIFWEALSMTRSALAKAEDREGAPPP